MIADGISTHGARSVDLVHTIQLQVNLYAEPNLKPAGLPGDYRED